MRAERRRRCEAARVSVAVTSAAAIAGEGDALGRDVGEALWPERFSLKALERIRANTFSRDDKRDVPHIRLRRKRPSPRPRPRPTRACAPALANTESPRLAIRINPAAADGWIQFEDGNLVYKDLQGYTTARLPRFGEGDPAHKPNTSCLCVGPDGALLTYASSSWAVRSAFNAQLWPPFARARKAFPVVTIGWRSLARCLRSR